MKKGFAKIIDIENADYVLIRGNSDDEGEYIKVHFQTDDFCGIITHGYRTDKDKADDIFENHAEGLARKTHEAVCDMIGFN